MADIDRVVTRTRRIEALLREHYHAEGKGLHQLISSCQERLPHELVPKLRYIATIRNKIVHEVDYKLDDRRGFLKTCSQCEAGLRPRSGRFIWGVALFFVLGFTLFCAWLYYAFWEEITLSSMVTLLSAWC